MKKLFIIPLLFSLASVAACSSDDMPIPESDPNTPSGNSPFKTYPGNSARRSRPG